MTDPTSHDDAAGAASVERTRASLQRVAVHVIARARAQTTGRFSLRVTPGGFGTPEFGDTCRRVRVSGSLLVVEDDAPGTASAVAIELDGASLADLARVARVDVTAPLDIGHDTPPLGDVHAPLVVNPGAAALLARWLELSVTALDGIVASLPPDAGATVPRLWPEHFDVALDAAARPGVRANLGSSAGDAFHDEPYLYVGPWTNDRPGDGQYWNAPFGAVLAASAVPDVDTALAFFSEGLRRLSG
jgi:hypothetical protein